MRQGADIRLADLVGDTLAETFNHLGAAREHVVEEDVQRVQPLLGTSDRRKLHLENVAATEPILEMLRGSDAPEMTALLNHTSSATWLHE